MVILVGSYYHRISNNGPHLKIECSPQFIAIHSPKILQSRLDAIARGILHDWTHQGVAVHLAVDLQGWKPAFDFLDKFKTYARMIRSYIGIQTAEIGQGFSEIAAKYGQGNQETITIGKPSGLQTSVYNKSKQVKVIDKVDYYDVEWNVHSLGFYDKQGSDVYRIEYRFHHSVIREMVFEDKTNFVSFEQIAKYLTGLWRYALVRNRLEIEENHIDPVWQKLYEDVRFNPEPPYHGVRKLKKNDSSSVVKNYELMLGNALSLLARKSESPKIFFDFLKGAGIYEETLNVYSTQKKIDETGFIEKFTNSFLERRLLSTAA